MAIGVVRCVVLGDVRLLWPCIVVLLMLSTFVVVGVTKEVGIVTLEVDGIPSLVVVLDETSSSVMKLLLDVVAALVR